VRIISREAPKSVKVKAEPVATICLNDNGGLSDNDEVQGEERKAAIASPPKGKTRVTSEVGVSSYLIQEPQFYYDQGLVIQSPSKTSEPAPKKTRIREFPAWIDQTWFRRQFVTTYMAFVGQMMDPWDVPVKQSTLVMQKIWDATHTHEYKITEDTPVYKKVRNQLYSRMILKLFQTIQRLADSWRATIGSTGIAIVMAFCDSHPDIAESDEDRVEFAKFYLENYRFLYRDSEGDNKKVCCTNCTPCKFCLTNS
jgi:hypothetical protein